MEDEELADQEMNNPTALHHRVWCVVNTTNLHIRDLGTSMFFDAVSLKVVVVPLAGFDEEANFGLITSQPISC